MATVGEAIAATLIAQWNVGTGGTKPDPIQYLVERPEKDPNPTVADAIYVWLPLRRTFDPIDVAEVYRNVTYTLRIVCHTKTSSARQLEIENEVDRILNSGTVITGATRQRVKEINDISNRSYSNLPKYISEVMMEVFTAMEVSATAYGTATTTTLTTDDLIVNTSITGNPTAALGATSLSDDLELDVAKKVIFDADADSNNYIYAALESQMNVIVEGAEMWRWFVSLIENRVPLRTTALISPSTDKNINIGITGTHRFDNIYADDFVNESSFKKFDEPLKLVSAFKQSKKDPYKLDNSFIDDWLRTRVKEQDVIEFPVFDEKTGETTTSTTLSKWTGKYRLKAGGVGNYADGHQDEDFEHEEGYSMTKTQLVLIQAIQELEERIKILEAR